MSIWARRATILIVGAWAALCLGSGIASAQNPTQPPKNCSDFTSQEQAQAFFDQSGGKTGPNASLDVDKDGKACEGLPSAGAAVPTTAPTASATPVPGTNTLPKNGAGTVAMALSGLTFLEAGYGLTLLAKRIGVRSRAVPVYLMRKLLRAAHEGRNEIPLTDDLYLVRRQPTKPSDDEPVSLELEAFLTTPAVEHPEPLPPPTAELPSRAMVGTSVYAVIARPTVELPLTSTKPDVGVAEPSPVAQVEPVPAVKVKPERDPDWAFFTPPS